LSSKELLQAYLHLPEGIASEKPSLADPHLPAYRRSALHLDFTLGLRNRL